MKRREESADTMTWPQAMKVNKQKQTNFFFVENNNECDEIKGTRTSTDIEEEGDSWKWSIIKLFFI